MSTEDEMYSLDFNDTYVVQNW